MPVTARAGGIMFLGCRSMSPSGEHNISVMPLNVSFFKFGTDLVGLELAFDGQRFKA